MDRIKVSDAAKLMHVSEQFIRVGMQRGTLPIGHAVKMKQWVYYISRPMLEEYVGKKIPLAATSGTAPKDGAERTFTIYHERGD